MPAIVVERSQKQEHIVEKKKKKRCYWICREEKVVLFISVKIMM